MNPKHLLVTLLVLLVATLTAAIVEAQGPRPGGRAPAALSGTAFTYQGQLKQSGASVNGSCDFQFGLWDDPATGPQYGVTQTVSSLPVSNGLFTTQLDFGIVAPNNVFTGTARYLASAVRCPAGGGSYTALGPRQPLTPAPYAFALPGLFTQQNATSPNVIGGYSGNVITPTLVGATIGGGGVSGSPNRVWANYATVGGGLLNTASGYAATIGAGESNTASGGNATIGGGLANTASSDSATVGGGAVNTASGIAATVGGGGSNTASDYYATIGGGGGNTASYYATIGGGYNNTASGNWSTIGGGDGNTASGYAATIGGGYNNTAAGAYSFAAGRRAKANHDGAFVWGDSTFADFASTANDQFLVRASSGVGINTNSPVAALHVYTTSVNPGNNTAVFEAPNIGPNASNIHYGTTGDWYIRSASGSGIVVLQDSGGNVGIGTAIPQAKLHVNGQIRVDSLASATSTNLCINANVLASCSSSQRYKINITDLGLGLDAIEQLHPVTFDWKGNGGRDLGLIAEEVNQVAPLLTTRNGDGQIEGVKYDQLTAVLVKGIQEQQQQIAELKKQNASLEARLAALEQASGTSARVNAETIPTTWVLFGGLIAAGLVAARKRR